VIIKSEFLVKISCMVAMFGLSCLTVCGQVITLVNAGFGDNFSVDVTGFTGNVPGWEDVGGNTASGVRNINDLALNPTPPLAYVLTGDAGART
jgi:hypothetical protein